jgi:hypothetical protein
MQSPPDAIPSIKDGCLMQSGMSVGQVGLYPISVLAWACFFVVMLVSTFFWFRALSPSPAVVIELQGQLLAQERELDSREGAIDEERIDWWPFKCAL